jgi:hypothetical protein
MTMSQAEFRNAWESEKEWLILGLPSPPLTTANFRSLLHHGALPPPPHGGSRRCCWSVRGGALSVVG